LEALHKVVAEHYKSLGEGSVRADICGIDLNFGFGLRWGRKATKETLTAGLVKGDMPPKLKTKVIEASDNDMVAGLVPVEVGSI